MRVWFPLLFLSIGFAPAAELPVREVNVDPPDSLRVVHLYNLEGSRVAFGGPVQALARSEKGQLRWLEPPWIMMLKDGKAKRQCFTARAVTASGTPLADGVYRVEGSLQLNGPAFDLAVKKADLVDLGFKPEGSRDLFMDSVVAAGVKLQALCLRHGLRMQLPDDPTPTQSWFDGKIALTDYLTAKPGFSRVAVPYATVSLLVDPTTGQGVEIIFSRRIHRDPLD